MALASSEIAPRSLECRSELECLSTHRGPQSFLVRVTGINDAIPTLLMGAWITDKLGKSLLKLALYSNVCRSLSGTARMDALSWTFCLPSTFWNSLAWSSQRCQHRRTPLSWRLQGAWERPLLHYLGQQTFWTEYLIHYALRILRPPYLLCCLGIQLLMLLYLQSELTRLKSWVTTRWEGRDSQLRCPEVGLQSEARHSLER